MRPETSTARRGGLLRTLPLALIVGWLATLPIAGSASRMDHPGSQISDSCADPVLNTFGIEFRYDQLWTMAQDGTLTRLENCQPVQVISVQGFRGVAAGLGWDRRRDQFVVPDPKLQEIAVIDLRGNVVREFPAPGTGSIGAAYDSTRDAYWVTDFETRMLYALDAMTGAPLVTLHLDHAHRIAGAAYDYARDAILYQDRVGHGQCYAVSCVTGAVLDSFPLPDTGLNGWEDNALAPDGKLWIHNFEYHTSFAFGGITTPAVRKSWGALKQRFR